MPRRNLLPRELFPPDTFPSEKVPLDKMAAQALERAPFIDSGQPGDGPDLDIFFAINGLPNQILTSSGSTNYTATDAPGEPQNGVAVALGDLDGDGDLDAFVVNEIGANLILFNDGSGSFTATEAPGDLRQSRNVAFGDLDLDGDLDIYLVNTAIGFQGGPDQIMFNDGAGNFVVVDVSVGGPLSSNTEVALGDLDGDGDVDAIVSNGGFTSTQILINDGDGNFTASNAPGGPRVGLSVALGDLDGDGDLDAVVGTQGVNQFLFNDGDGNFTAMDAPGGIQSSSGVAIGDVDGDGDLDILVANRFGPLELLTNDGSGNFTVSDALSGEIDIYDVALADLDGDGDVDAVLATLESFDGTNLILINDGTGSFTVQALPGGASNSFGVAIGDLDGDGPVPPANEDGLPNLGEILLG